MERDADVVIIGSGAGGMATAVALANHGKKVIVCEQHDVPGGWCHTFNLEGHRFSPGVHYLGDLGEGGLFRQILQGLGVAQDLVLFALNPKGYDRYRAPGLAFDHPAGREALLERLVALSPGDRRGITDYLDLVGKVAFELGEIEKVRGFWELLSIPYKTRHLGRYGFQTLETVLRRRIGSPLVRNLLGIQGGDYGLPPSRAPFAMHAAIANHYIEGGYYPKGGGGAWPKVFGRKLKSQGGEILLSTAVERILLEGGRAIGVRLADGRELRATHVVSNADPHVTYNSLVGAEHLPSRLVRKLERTRYSVASVGLFFSLDMDLEALGFDSGNTWWLREPNCETAFGAGTADDVLTADELSGMFLTVTSLKDRTHRRQHHTLEAFGLVPYAPFARFADSRFGERPPEYVALKERITQVMLRTVERLIPDARRHVVFAELGTPLTNWHYVRATEGNMYGTEKSRGQLGPFAFPVVTPFKGLRHCGASTVAHGVMGATLSGLTAAESILRIRRDEMLNQAGAAPRTFLADAPETWPAELRRQIRVGRGAWQDKAPSGGQPVADESQDRV